MVKRKISKVGIGAILVLTYWFILGIIKGETRLYGDLWWINFVVLFGMIVIWYVIGAAIEKYILKK